MGIKTPSQGTIRDDGSVFSKIVVSSPFRGASVPTSSDKTNFAPASVHIIAQGRNSEDHTVVQDHVAAQDHVARQGHVVAQGQSHIAVPGGSSDFNDGAIIGFILSQY